MLRWYWWQNGIQEMLFFHRTASTTNLWFIIGRETRVFCGERWLWIDGVAWTTSSKTNTNFLIESKANVLYFSSFCLTSDDRLWNKNPCPWLIGNWIESISSPVSGAFRFEGTLPKSFSLLPSAHLGPFAEELFDKRQERQWLNIFQRRISTAEEDDLLTFYEIFIKYLPHSLPLLKTFVTKLGVYIQQQIDWMRRLSQFFQVKKVRTLLKRFRSVSRRGL